MELEKKYDPIEIIKETAVIIYENYKNELPKEIENEKEEIK